MSPLNKLVNHSTWANGEWIEYAARAFAGDEFVLVRLSHILLGERAWFDRISGEMVERHVWRTMTLPVLRELNRKHAVRYERLLESDVSRVIAYRRFTGEEYQSPVSDILLHLTLHGAHHRGQIATYVSSQGKPPINTDFIQYCLAHGC